MDEQIERVAKMMAAAYWRGRMYEVTEGRSLEQMIAEAADRDIRKWMAAARYAITGIPPAPMCPQPNPPLAGAPGSVSSDLGDFQSRGFLLFWGEAYYPIGGWWDYKGAFTTILEAKQAIPQRAPSWWQIIDARSLRCVEADGGSCYGEGVPGADQNDPNLPPGENGGVK